MAVEGVDYAFSNPSPAGLAAAGKRFAMRYVGPGTSPKHLTVAEAKALQAAGLSVVLLVEGAADSARGGRIVGQDHARQALAMCKARGFPTNRPFYFAVDYDVSSASWPGPREYLRGACDVLGLSLVGVYGECDVMAWAARDKVAAWFFQTYAWSVGKWYAGNHVEQYRNGVALAGGVVDLCRAKVADFGQWPIAAPHPPSKEEAVVSFVSCDGKLWLVADATRFHLKTPAAAAARLAEYGKSWNDVRPVSADYLRDGLGKDVEAIGLTLTDADREALADAVMKSHDELVAEIRNVVDSELDEAFRGGADNDPASP